MTDTIRVFIGTDGDFHQDAEKVIEYSIHTNTKEPVEVNFIRPGWKTPPTGFSSHRYLIPSLCNYEGYAIYLDVDMLVLGDLRELWDYRTEGRWCITNFDPKGLRDEVSVIDCSAFQNIPLDDLRTNQGKTIGKNAVKSKFLINIPSTWNEQRLCTDADKYSICSSGSCDGRMGETKLIHYTNLQAQPWCPDPNIDYVPYGCIHASNLFFEYLEKANQI